MVARSTSTWRCQTCGSSSVRWIGRCPDCGEFGTFVEEVDARTPSGTSRPVAGVSVPLSDASTRLEDRFEVGIGEFDRVLGGGLVRGGLVLLGGEPGIGKSTLLLQIAEAVAGSGGDVLYVCGEESPAQIGLRAARLGVRSDRIGLLPETDVTVVEETVRAKRPSVLILDSIQTAIDPDLVGAPGSVGQVRACTARMLRIAKDLDVTTLIVGHVTKDGAIAGPRVLEHMVDTVLYFEGDRDHAFRIVRSVKNRFGPSGETGIFEMTETGLLPVDSPSEVLLAEYRDGAPGSAVMVAVEGTRPLLIEIQALVNDSYLPAPRRLATGIDATRLLQVIAVLERRAGVTFAGKDVLVSVTGGVRIAEPAIDVPLALALVSALRDRPVPPGLASFGEIGLTGHVRQVAHAKSRMKEAVRLGMARVAGPERGLRDGDDVEALAISTVQEAIDLLR